MQTEEFYNFSNTTCQNNPPKTTKVMRNNGLGWDRMQQNDFYIAAPNPVWWVKITFICSSRYEGVSAKYFSYFSRKHVIGLLVLRFYGPVNPIIMSSAVSLPNHTFTGQA